MATSNTQVTAYLPVHLLEYLTNYCTQYGIVRKKDNKPLLATGIVDLLNIVATIPIEDLTKFTPAKINEDTLEKKLSDSKVVGKLLDTLLGNEELKQRLINAVTPDNSITEDKTLLSTLPDNLPITEDEDNNNLLSNVPDTLLDTLPITEDEGIGIEDTPPDKPELAPESGKKENTPKKGNKRKGGNYDKVMQYINSLPNGATVKNVTTLAKDIGVDSSFFSPSKNSGIKIWEQYFIAGKDDKGEDCYILTKPE